MGAPRNDAKATAMYELYKSGNSLSEVAQAFGVTRQGVFKMFAKRGFALRPRPQPLDYVEFMERKYTLRKTGYYGATTGARTYLHRDTWEAANGPIPYDYDIHHRNGEKADNRTENLELISKSDHTRLYGHRGNQHTKRA